MYIFKRIIRIGAFIFILKYILYIENLNETLSYSILNLCRFQADQRRIFARFKTPEAAGLFFSILITIWALYFARNPATSC